MKKQTTIRMSEATREKLAKLAARYGTQTEVVAVAIDRLYREEVIQMAKRFFVAVCDCGAKMRTHSVSGNGPEFNEQGDGVWSTEHADGCGRSASDADWQEVSEERYHAAFGS